MNDIAGLNWTSKSGDGSTTKPSYAFPTLRPTPPTSGRASPLNAPKSGPPSKPGTPNIDSFSNLVSFSSAAANKNLSLQEQQKRLGEIKLQQEASQSRNFQEQYAGGDDSFWNNLGSGRSTPAAGGQTQKNGTAILAKKPNEEEDDIFASFNATGKVHIDAKYPQSSVKPNLHEDDDPFGLSDLQARNSSQPAQRSHEIQSGEDDDLLGLLGQPVSSKPSRVAQTKIAAEPSPETHPQDKAIAELVDMGFPTDKSRQALETTESGTDVQAAVSWLLNQAHSQARQKSQATTGNGKVQQSRDSQDSASWQQMGRNDDPITFQRRDRPSKSTNAATDRDPVAVAAEFRSNFLKTAGSLWKEGTKRVQQVVQDFNSDSESNQPKWMKSESSSRPDEPSQRDAQIPVASQRRRQSSPSREAQQVTDEAMMLELSRPTQPSGRSARPRQDPRLDSSADSSRDHSPAVPSRLRDGVSPQPTFQRPRQPAPAVQNKPTLTRQAIEEQAAQAYVSSARRRKPASQPISVQLPSASESNLLEESSPKFPGVRSSTKLTSSLPSSTLSRVAPLKSTTTPVPPPVPLRTIPPVSAMSLKASNLHREQGNEHFKRGDYSAAHQSYTTAISHLPAEHPILAILLTNHALTSLKIGEPRIAVLDSDKAITLIGLSKGESEAVDLANGQAPKPMRDYYGKALMRKAEALEQMEKWIDAAAVWREAVEGGHGGSTSIQGRLRAEKAANPEIKKPKQPPVKKPLPKAKPSALSELNGAQQFSRSSSSAAVGRLRAANAAAEKADDEKFALSESIDARITAWKGTRADNLRALLSSLDSVLWPEAGWKKISMADLVLPPKVKIQYMKGIAKVHPDKIPTNATTEQRMIAGAVFSTLNEAWEKFKTENGL